MKKIFTCDCNTHLFEVEYENVKCKDGQYFPLISFLIYDIYNPKTGRKYKKAKLIADVVFTNEKKIDFIIDFLNKIELSYMTRKH